MKCKKCNDALCKECLLLFKEGDIFLVKNGLFKDEKMCFIYYENFAIRNNNTHETYLFGILLNNSREKLIKMPIRININNSCKSEDDNQISYLRSKSGLNRKYVKPAIVWLCND